MTQSLDQETPSQEEASADVTPDNPGQVEETTCRASLASPVPVVLQPEPAGSEEVPVRPFYCRFLHHGPSRIKLLRFLVAKLVYSSAGEGLSVADVVALFDLRDYFAQKMDKDAGFRGNFVDSFSRLNQLCSFFGRIKFFPVRLERISDEQLQHHLGNLFLTERAYQGCLGQKAFRNAFVLVLRSSEVPKPLELRWMGVGQRESGGRRDVGYDGSPHWTEVFKAITPQELLEDEEESSILSHD